MSYCLRCFVAFLTFVLAGSACAQELPTVAGWRMALPTAETHRCATDLSRPHAGKGCGKIVGTTSQNGARAAFTQEFYGKNALKPGRTYRYAVTYRSEGALEGSGQLLIDSYTAEGEKGRKQLAARKLGPSDGWQTLAGEVDVPDKAVRVRMLLYLRGKGTLYYDDAFFGDPAEGSPNRLANGGFEPPGCYVYDLAPERRSGAVRLAADFENSTLGKVKQIGPDEFYAYAFAEGRPHSPFLWFHFRVEGCAGRELTFHINPAPFSQDKTGGNGTRLPVVSEDGAHWTGVADKRWNDDGTVLTFKHRFTKSPAWVASFFPFTAEHVSRFIDEHKGNPHFQVSVLGQTQGGRPLRMFTITDPAVAESSKRVIMFTALQHDLETTGAMALEGICRFLLSADPRAAGLRRQFVFYAVPMMNPDGIAAGNMYCPVGNLNRQWGLGTTAETACVERFAKGLTARGRKIELFMDFHGWCTPERRTLFMTHGPEITDAFSAADSVRLADTIRPRLSGKVTTIVRNKMVEYVTMGETDLRRLAAGWMKFEAPARLAYSIEIFGEGDCTQQQYLDWGRAMAEGMAEFYAK